jgi:hypothetical protein
VIVLFAERDEDQLDDLARLPELSLQPLSDADARELLASSRLGPLDERVGRRISPRRAETRSPCSSCLTGFRRRASPAALPSLLRCH